MADRPADRPDDARAEAQDPPPTVLEQVSRRIGQPSKVSLPDEGSEHAASPLIDARSPDTRSLPEGKGNYQVLGEIARGGMGVIMKSHDTDLGRDVAMKVLRNEHAANETILQRFVEEAQIGGQLQHPGIVPVYELGLMADDRPYFTMKLVKGRTLAKLLSEREAGDRRRFLTIFEKVCETVAYAHARNVLHRDLKPANIMVGAFGEVQVVDWGLAKVLKEGGTDDERAAQEQLSQVSIIETVRSGSSTGAGTESMVGSIMGTPAYMPPEQATGEIEALDERADVFALGAILCEILTGKPPYVGDRDKVISSAAKARLDEAKERLAESGADDEVIAICLECMAPAKAARPRDAEQLLERVHAWSAGQEQRVQDARVAAAEAAVEARAASKARALTLALAVTVLAVGLGGAWFWADAQGRAAEAREALVADVDVHLDAASSALGEADFPGALAACDLADAALAASNVADDSPAFADGLTARVDALRAAVAEAERTAEGERAERERYATFLAELRGITLGDGFDELRASTRASRVDDFAAAFARLGVDATSDPLDELVPALRVAGDDLTVAAALDEYGRLERSFGWDRQEARHLLAAARRLDPDPTRVRLRDAIEAEDRAALEELAASDDVLDWPPATLVMFGLSIRDLGLGIDMHELFERSLRRNPGDPLLHQLLSGYYVYVAEDYAAAAEALMAALAVNPTNSRVAARLAGVRGRQGRYDEAVEILVQAYRRSPEDDWLMGIALDNLLDDMSGDERAGFYQEAFRQAVAAGDDSSRSVGNYHWFRVTGRDADAATLEDSIEVLRETVAADPSSADVILNTIGLAELRLGRPEQAMVTLQASMEANEGTVYLGDGLGVAVALWDLGKRETAREWYRQMKSLRGTPEDSWELAVFWEMAEERLGR